MGVGTKMVIIMLSITTILWFSGYYGLPMQTDLINMSCDNVSDINTNCTIPKNNLGVLQSNNTFLPNVPIFGLFNTFGLVYGTIYLLFAVFFAPVATMLAIGAPAFLVIMLGVVWMVMYIIAIMSFVRGWDF